MTPPTMAAVGAQQVTGTLLADLALILGVAYVFAWLAGRLRQPAVLGEIIAGLALGPVLLGLLPGNATEALFPTAVLPYLQVLAQLGLVMFMFGVGYELDVSHLRGMGRQVAAISGGALLLPFVLGTGLAVTLYPWFDLSELKTDSRVGPSLFLGAAMAITAFPVLARIIAERGLQRDRTGTIALASAAVQDVLAWCLLAAVAALVKATGAWPLAALALQLVLFVGVLVGVVRPGLSWLLAPQRRWRVTAPFVQVLLVTGLLSCAWATDAMGLHAVFGAFAFGACVPRGHIDALAPEVPERIEQTSLLLLPVFFTVTGLSVDFSGLGWKGAAIVVAVILVACAGKFVGAVSAARLVGLPPRQAATLGVLLNARGLTELVILNVGLSLGAIDTMMFTAMVIMAVVTTLITGPLLQLVSREPTAVERSGEREIIP
ncbi:cation:proton antiporter [Streptomyces sp. NBC_01518]|uniref:cation:proton antiporter n=1 Tax=Streptomyces sp. NBC_01518 TaxID=2903891 RepID=UPI00386C8DA9